MIAKSRDLVKNQSVLGITSKANIVARTSTPRLTLDYYLSNLTNIRDLPGLSGNSWIISLGAPCDTGTVSPVDGPRSHTALNNIVRATLPGLAGTSGIIYSSVTEV